MALIDVMAPASRRARRCVLRARWGLRAAETLAIGDNWNDRGMLEQAGLGFVMGNADPAMHRLGLPVLPSNEEDGVAVAIEEHVLTQKKKGVIAHPPF